MVEMIKAIFFDLGGVLTTDLFPLLDSYLSGITGLPYPKVREIRKQYWLDYELGRMDGLKFFSLQIKDMGADLYAEEVMAKSLELLTVKQETLSIVKRLKDTGKYDLGVLSNNSDEWAEYTDKDLGLGQYFDVWIISSHHHVKKPDKEIFLLAAEKLGLRTEDCLFIDNTQRNVDGAIAAGMRAIRFTDTEQLEKDLKRLGIDF